MMAHPVAALAAPDSGMCYESGCAVAAFERAMITVANGSAAARGTVGKWLTMTGSGGIEIPDYARSRMDQRKISENQVRRALANPDRVWQSYDGRMIAERATATGAVLRVVYVDRPEGPLVVTVVRIGDKRHGP